MDNRTMRAVEYFNQGYNCAQAVFCAFADLFPMEDELAKRVTAGLGAGIGRLQNICGAVSGAVLVLGAVYFDAKDVIAAKELTYQKTQELIFDFAAKNNTAICLDLLGVDLRTEKGKKTFQEKNLMQSRCEQYIMDACHLLLTKHLK